MISIITPAYNCEPWLRSTVETVMAQTYTDWELLLINDGSVDATQAIMDEMASKDSRIRSIYSEHKGVAAIRNMGIEMARGEFLFFLDADDMISPDALQYLIEMMMLRADISVSCGEIKRFEDGDRNISKLLKKKTPQNIKAALEAGKGRILTPEEGVRLSLYQTGLEASLCGKLFRRSLFNDLRFIEGELYEDLDIFFRLLLKGEMIASGNQVIYLYRQRSGSIIHTFDSRRLIVLEVTRRICDYMEKHYPQLLPAAVDRRFAANFNMLQLMLRHYSELDFDADKEIESTYRFIRNHARQELANNEIRMKNRMGALAALLLPKNLLFRLLMKLKNN